jgi:hypothetical protein
MHLLKILLEVNYNRQTDEYLLNEEFYIFDFIDFIE